MSNTSKLAYAIAFQAGWFVCIMGGNLLSIIYVGIFLGLHFSFVKKLKHNTYTKSSLKKEILWILIVFIFGLTIEFLSFFSGALYFKTANNLPISNSFFEHFNSPPLWLLSLWVMFAIALRSCLSFLLNSSVITIALLIIFVPLNYYAGANLNATVNINQPYFISLAFITLLWVICLTSLIKIKHHYFEEIFNAD